jgi:hypothetical protein
MIECPICGKLNEDGTKYCAGCNTWLIDKGVVVKRRRMGPLWLWAVILLIVVGGSLGAFLATRGGTTPKSGTSLQPFAQPTSPQQPFYSRTATPTPKIPVLEVGQSAQFPGFIVTLRRAIWEGDVLETYWLYSNNGTKTIDLGWKFGGEFEATDSAGNTGGYSYSSPEWDDVEKTLPVGSGSELWPGQQAVDHQEWKFGPLSKGIRVSFTYTETVSISSYQVKQYQVMWNTGR